MNDRPVIDPGVTVRLGSCSFEWERVDFWGYESDDDVTYVGLAVRCVAAEFDRFYVQIPGGVSVTKSDVFDATEWSQGVDWPDVVVKFDEIPNDAGLVVLHNASAVHLGPGETDSSPVVQLSVFDRDDDKYPTLVTLVFAGPPAVT